MPPALRLLPRSFPMWSCMFTRNASPSMGISPGRMTCVWRAFWTARTIRRLMRCGSRAGIWRDRIAGDAMARLNLAARHKTYLGYSDMGYLLAGLYRHKIGRPVHGPMVADGRRAGGEDALRRALDWLSGGREGLEPSLAEEAHPVAAFNLTTLAMLAGTPLMPGLAGHVVMVEEVSEYLYAVDRLFFHATAHLAGIAGLRLGRVSDVPENERPFGASALDIAKDWCGRHAIPFLGEADIGHDAGNRIVPFGRR
jgi:muramoyltetrapeptide carboxypeptidase